MTALTDMLNIGKEMASKLKSVGIDSAEDLTDCNRYLKKD